MSARDRYLKDYGLTYAEGKKIVEYCGNARGYDQVLLLQVAQKVKPEIAHLLFTNLTTGIGYDNISKKHYIPMQRKDFQGYRRQTIEEYNRMMLLTMGKSIV